MTVFTINTHTCDSTLGPRLKTLLSEQIDFEFSAPAPVAGSLGVYSVDIEIPPSVERLVRFLISSHKLDSSVLYDLKLDSSAREGEITTLTEAYEREDMATFAKLLDAGENPNQMLNKRYLLELAAENNKLVAAQLLLQAGADPRLKSQRLDPMRICVQKNHKKLLEIFLEFNLPQDLIQSAIEFARLQKNKTVEDLLTGRALPPLAPCYQQLINAVSIDSPEAIQDAVTDGADVNMMYNDNLPMLHYAIFKNKLETVKKMVELGADPCTPAKDGKSALDAATERGSQPMIAFIAAKMAECRK